jgi:hypothetical protein
MNSRIALWIIIGILFVLALFLTFQAGAAGIVENTQTATITAQNVASYDGMVGGC